MGSKCFSLHMYLASSTFNYIKTLNIRRNWGICRHLKEKAWLVIFIHNIYFCCRWGNRRTDQGSKDQIVLRTWLGPECRCVPISQSSALSEIGGHTTWCPLPTCTGDSKVHHTSGQSIASYGACMGLQSGNIQPDQKHKAVPAVVQASLCSHHPVPEGLRDQ